MSFRVGDVVRLKSGGPEMTVQEVDQVHDMVDCRWFDGTKSLRDEFPSATLEKAKPRALGVAAGSR